MGSRTMEWTPTLSVIITCYNYETYVDQAIKSALDQACENFEIIVVDDGSTDGSWDIIQAYQTRHPGRVRAIRQANAGALRSSLAGFAIATGDFVCFLDADDYLNAEALPEITSLLSPEVSKVQFMLTPVDRYGQPIGKPFPPLDIAENSQSLMASIAVRGHYVTPPTSGNVYRRDVYDTVIADARLLDYERAIDGIAYLLAPFLGQVVSVDRPLGSYRIHDANLSGFATLSAERMNGYADRFMGRLRHLDRILAHRQPGRSAAFAYGEYSYALEMRIMARIAAGERIAWSNLSGYLRASRREYGLRRVLLAFGFGILLMGLPIKIGRRLVAVRMNPSKLSGARVWLKRAVMAKRVDLQAMVGSMRPGLLHVFW